MPTAITAGIGVLEYYELTFAEVAVVVKAYNDNEKVTRQNEAINTYIQADLITAGIARLLDSKAKFPEIQDVYPHLFDGQVSDGDNKPKQQDWRVMKARLLAFAEGRQDATEQKKKKGVINEFRDA